MKSFKNKELLKECFSYVRLSFKGVLNDSVENNLFSLEQLTLLLSFLPYNFKLKVIKKESF